MQREATEWWRIIGLRRTAKEGAFDGEGLQIYFLDRERPSQVSNDQAPAPTVTRNSDPRNMERSVRASLAAPQNP